MMDVNYLFENNNNRYIKKVVGLGLLVPTVSNNKIL